MKAFLKRLLFTALVIAAALAFLRFVARYMYENRVLNEVIARLEADTRVAEVLVTGVNYDDKTGKVFTTIKFLEYDVGQAPLAPRYFTFSGNIIQFQSLVIRFDDIRIRKADRLRGKSAYLFWKVFMLDGKDTQEYELTKLGLVPEGYKLKDYKSPFEKKLWERFWKYAFSPEEAQKLGVKNVQIEAPGAMFIPGMLYTIHIEHDGGLRIDSSALPAILKGERIPD